MTIFRPGYVATVLLILLASPFTHAADKEEKERAARRACLSGDHAKGVEILSDLFIDTKNASYIYNQGRCFEQNSRHHDAIGRFREYLRLAPSQTSAERADVDMHIADCQALLDQRSMAPSPSPAVQPQTLPPIGEVQQTNVASNAGSAPNPGRGLRIGGIACGVLGLASVGTGIYYYTQAKSYSDRVSGQPIHNPTDMRAGEDAEKMQWVFYTVGASAIATGTVLYLLGSSSANNSLSTTGLAPLLGPGLAGISAQGVF